MKQQRKLFAILTLVAFMMTLLPMAAFAATANNGLTAPTLKTGDAQNVGNLRITETEETYGSIGNGDHVTITLPEGAKFVNASAITVADVVYSGTGVSVADIVSANDRSFTFEVGRTNFTDRAAFTVMFSNAALAVDITGVSGAFEVEVFSANGGVTNGKVTVANIVSGATVTYALGSKDVKLGESDEEIGALRLIETTPGALAATKKIKLTLPADVEWSNDVSRVLVRTTGGYAANNLVTGPSAPATDTSGRSYVEFTVTTASSGAPGVIEISGLKVNVDEKRVGGEIEVTVGGAASAATLVLAKVVDYGYEITAKEVKTIYLGTEKTELPEFFVKEKTHGSITPGRTIKVTLPEGFIWVTAPTLTREKGTRIFETVPTPVLSEDKRTLSWRDSATQFSNSKVELKFKGGEIASKLDNKFAGDIELTFEGTSNVAGEITVATAVAPVSVTGVMSNTIIGKQNQPLNDITIKEVAAEKITARVGSNTAQLVVYLPNGYEFSKTPKVEVVEGNLELDTKDIKRAANSTQLVIPIKRSSTVASTLKISGIEVTIDRTPAEGDYEITVGGSAVNRAHTLLNVDEVRELDTSATNGWKFKGVRITTPAPGDKTFQGTVKFNIGSMFYTVDNNEFTMDVAPYEKGGRTYLPIRFAATATGVDYENVIWNGASQTVTIINDARVIQLTIGSNEMVVNGTTLYMDAAPEIVDGRTMLPIRFVAQALGKTVDYDATDRAVTIE